ncbi:hypothetical protein M9H77_00331 [Catharanthus roseus]|nr:hypothetical protein M9H77_00331 [Catharanthus roseus]
MAIEKPLIISKSIIKPSSPTPNHLRTYKLSLLDQLSPHFYMPMVLFYRKQLLVSWNANDISFKLKKSLSETLTQYYPFAGRFNGKDSIDCNDEGLDYYEARIDCSVDDIIKQPEPTTMDLFSPQNALFNQSFKASPFIVQITYFTCGGIAITGAILHKVGDACTQFAFINDWVAVASGEKPFPIFIPSLISPFTGQIPLPQIKLDDDHNKIVTRRFSFDGSKIAELKAIVGGGRVDNPTRVQVVSALIYRCAMAAAKQKSGMSKPSILMQTVNLRPIVKPPLPENSVGNFSWLFSILSKDENEKTDLQEIVSSMKKQNGEFRDKYGKELTVDECYSVVCESIKDAIKVLRGNNDSDIVIYKCSSLCRYSLTEMNFGWGKPVLVGTFASQMKNTFHLLDSCKPGGIDAIVALDEQEMALFEKDEMLLQFAARKPATTD